MSLSSRAPRFFSRRQLGWLLAVAVGGAGEGRSAAAPDFNREIRPILSDRCYRCHGPDAADRKGGLDGLRLDTREGALADLGGGGFAVVPGDPGKSELLQRVRSENDDEIMPPRDAGKALSREEIALLERWIASGAPYARHWSYEPPREVAPPATGNAAWVRNRVDAYIVGALDAAGLSPQPEADRATLARRVALDLTGLPPSIEEVEAFRRDPAADAYERFVDAQLAKPAYGEHWARAWLDLARYADSKGYADDQPRSIWRYRDYVIDAFNRNLPFDQFTIEQLAGDLLPNATEEQLFATGFHRNTMTNTEGGTDDEEFRSAAVVDRVNTTMAVWMGTSMACAQCHTHKYDPLTHKEYFQLYALFNQTEDADRADDAPVREFLTAELAQERARHAAEIVQLTREMSARREPHAAAAAAWAERVGGFTAWQTPTPRAVTSKRGATVTLEAEGRVRIAPGQKTDTYTLELPPTGGTQVAALRLEAWPQATLPQGGPGGAPDGRFVVTKVRVGIAGAAPQRLGRFVRVELPGRNRTLSLGEVEVFSAGRNLALGGAASQSSTANGAEARHAKDGVAEGHPDRAALSTTMAENDPWWEIDLGRTEPLDRVVVWARTGLEPTPAGVRVLVLDASRQVVWEQTWRGGATAQREFPLSGPHDQQLARVMAEATHPDFDASTVVRDGAPRRRPEGPPHPSQRGWSLPAGVATPQSLVIEPAAPLELAAGERLVVTIEQQSEVEHATLNHFRLRVTSDEHATRRLRMTPAERTALQTPPERRAADQHAALLHYYVREIAPEFAAERRRLAEAQRQLDEMPVPSSPILRERPPHEHRPTFVHLRGDFRAAGETVTGGVPEVFPPLPPGERPNRLSLARWLVAPENPLTARVQANRLWEAIFGLGLVRTSEEFGSQGEPPSHPQLLDWLALELVRMGWDQKRFLRLLVTSATYRQRTHVTPVARERDPENRLLSRGPRVRLTAEMIRDQALAVSGLLNPKLHGPSVRPFQPAFGLSAAFGTALDWQTSAGADRWRRGLYTEWRRSSPYPSMVTFDAPNREVCTLRRTRSNTPLQALVTLNDPVFLEAAQALGRLIAAQPGGDGEKLAHGFHRVLARPPSADETRALLALYEDLRDGFQPAPEKTAAFVGPPPPGQALSPASPELAGWVGVANVLLNLDETLMKR
jgi:hypothetical protein